MAKVILLEERKRLGIEGKSEEVIIEREE
jgi:hypothetical protein